MKILQLTILILLFCAGTVVGADEIPPNHPPSSDVVTEVQAEQATGPQMLTIGLDWSGSNILLSSPEFALEAAKFVGHEIRRLNHDDKVRLRTLGTREITKGKATPNLLTQEVVIHKRRKRADSVATAFEEYIKSLPGRDVAQSSTNIVTWFEFGRGFECANGGRVVLISDGLESSEYVSDTEFAQKAKGLPAAEVNLQGCSIAFYGLGAGLSASSTKYVLNEWKRWMGQAGASFDAYIPQ